MKRLFLRAVLLITIASGLSACAYQTPLADARCGAPEPFTNCGAMTN
jgi:predicted small lipoprotein YifL